MLSLSLSLIIFLCFQFTIGEYPYLGLLPKYNDVIKDSNNNDNNNNKYKRKGNNNNNPVTSYY